MAKILLVEDDKNIVENLSAVLGAEGFQVRTASGQREALKAVEQESFDLLLLDIEMPERSGMELARQVHQKLPQALIIFVTAYFKYAVDAYELNIFRYIPKNQLSARLMHAVTDAAAVLETQDTQSYLISSQSRMERIPLKHILYLVREGKNGVFYLSSQKEPVRLRKSLAEIYAELPEDEFVFIDRGCIVNLRHVSGIVQSDCVLTDSSRLLVAQSRLAELSAG